MAQVHNENRENTMSYFRRFSVREPRHSETKNAKKRYTSIVACVGSTFAEGGPWRTRKAKTAKF